MLIFNIFYCFWNVCKWTFHISHARISQKAKGVLMWNLQHVIFIWIQRWGNRIENGKDHTHFQRDETFASLHRGNIGIVN